MLAKSFYSKMQNKFMNSQPLVCICIPCYNEAKRLPISHFKALAAQRPDCSFLFVNDGSKDNTLALLNELAAGASNLSVLNLKQNVGKAEAVRQGMLHAYATFHPDYIGFWDADLATPREEISKFVAVIHENSFDAVTGLRLMRLGARVKRSSMRHYLGRIFATVAAHILGVHVYDTQCGAKLYRATLVTELFSEKFITRWFFDVEILARYIKLFGVALAEQKIYEYPVYQWEDVGSSRLKLKDFITVPLELLKIKRKYF
jgi:glycosyltransferase involved in cell wall biosynthesis